MLQVASVICRREVVVSGVNLVYKQDARKLNDCSVNVVTMIIKTNCYKLS